MVCADRAKVLALHQPPVPDELVTLLRELVAGQRLVLAELQAIRSGAMGPKTLNAVDAKALGALLPVLAKAVEGREFTTSELFAFAGLEVAPDIPLSTALAAIGGTRKVGRLLKRGSGVAIGGFEIEQIGCAREGLLFKCGAVTRETRSA